MLYLVNGNIAFDVSDCRLQQILRRIKTIDILQADGGLPDPGFFPAVRFVLLYIFIKIAYFPVSLAHLSIVFVHNEYE